ncbi:hypothetical protein M2277_003290 [Paenibacillus sp. LBL]|nr:hypothetical protein [Paenibacillus sp. LBL]
MQSYAQIKYIESFDMLHKKKKVALFRQAIMAPFMGKWNILNIPF